MTDSGQSVTVTVCLSEMEAHALRAILPEPGRDTSFTPEWVRAYARSAIEAIVKEMGR
jgi:hypothetical protein